MPITRGITCDYEFGLLLSTPSMHWLLAVTMLAMHTLTAEASQILLPLLLVIVALPP